MVGNNKNGDNLFDANDVGTKLMDLFTELVKQISTGSGIYYDSKFLYVYDLRENLLKLENEEDINNIFGSFVLIRDLIKFLNSTNDEINLNKAKIYEECLNLTFVVFRERLLSINIFNLSDGFKNRINEILEIIK